MAKAWHLVRRPQGLPTIDDFALHALPDLPLETDQLRVRNHWLSVDPYMRGRMNDAKSYAASFQLDQPMTGGAIGEVVESAMDGFAPGDIILHMGGWRDGGIIGLEMTPTKLPADLLAAGMPPQTFLHNMGLTGGTAWIGLLRIAAAKPGDTVFVSAAAGAVGSAVVQIAKAREMTVIGSAGGAENAPGSRIWEPMPLWITRRARLSPRLPKRWTASAKAASTSISTMSGEIISTRPSRSPMISPALPSAA